MQRKVTGKKHRLVKVLLTLPLIVLVLSLCLSPQLYTGAYGPSYNFMLFSFVIVHLRIRPRWVDVALVVLITALLATTDFCLSHYPPHLMAYFSFLGVSSFAIVAVRSIWDGQERRLLLYAWVPAAIFVITGPLAGRMHGWTLKARPQTLDLYLLSFDGSLRVQLAFSIGQYYARLPWLHNPTLVAYLGVPIPMALVYAGRLVRLREGAFPSMLAFLIAGPMGFLFYYLFPACGPLYVFGQAFPFHPPPIAILPRLALGPIAIPGWRNAMPSLHLTWALLPWWYSKGLSWIERLVAFAFLVLTGVATLGTGEHWFVDLIVAFPYALMIQAICAYHVPWKDPARKAALFLGLGGILGWMAVLRYGTELFWTSPIVPWALSAGTVALVLLRQAKLDTVANLGKLTAAAASPTDQQPDQKRHPLAEKPSVFRS
jgi:hypothetical protein